MKLYPSIPIELTAAGGTYDISLLENYDHYFLYGTDNWVANWAFQPTPGHTPYGGMRIDFYLDYKGNPGGNTLTVFGNTLTDNQTTGYSVVRCRYDEIAAAWDTWILPNTDAADWITTAQIEAEAITLALMADLARGSIISGQTVNNRPLALDCKVASAILIGDGTDVNAIVPTGDVTITIAGVTAIGADKVTKTMLNVDCAGSGTTQAGDGSIEVKPDVVNGTSVAVTADGVRLTGDQTAPGSLKIYGTNATGTKGWYDNSTLTNEAYLTIATADVKLLFGTPLEIVAAPGANKGIVIEEAVMYLTYNSATYDTNTTLWIVTDTAEIAQFIGTTYLASSKTVAIQLNRYGVVGKTQIIANKGVNVFVTGGNPATGDSEVIIYVKYTIIDM